jgi:hypothetical protein
MVGLPRQSEMPERGQFCGDCSQATAQAQRPSQAPCFCNYGFKYRSAAQVQKDRALTAHVNTGLPYSRNVESCL